MFHTVRPWMKSPVITIDPDTSVSHALTLMRRRNIHSLVIDLGGTIPRYGIITSTDIRDKIIAADRDPAQTLVREIMTAPLTTASPDWSLKQCSLQMQRLNIHHLPVADESGALTGMISATDLFMAAEEIGWEKSD